MRRNHVLTHCLLGLSAMAFFSVASVAPLQAADREPPSIPEPREKASIPFRGKVDSVDTSARTLTVNNKLINLNDATKLTKLGRDITIYEIMVGDDVHGLARQTFDGRTEAISVMVGPERKE